jgi:hypothetical protein
VGPFCRLPPGASAVWPYTTGATMPEQPPKATILASIPILHPWPDAPRGFRRCKTLTIRWRLREDGSITSQVEGIGDGRNPLPRDAWPPNLDTSDRTDVDPKSGKPTRLRLTEDDRMFPGDCLQNWLIASAVAVDQTPPAPNRLSD